MARFRNVVFTWNNPDGMITFDSEKMGYLVYQEEVGESGTYHFQGYCEFVDQISLNPAKALLGGPTVHIERRRGTQEQAIAYAKKEDTRVDGPYEDGEPRQQGKRMDLEGFKDEVLAGAKMRDLIHDHAATICRYPRFYNTLTQLNRPGRRPDLVVTLLYGPTGTGKTRYVYDTVGDDDDFYRTPMSNNTNWYDGYDGHSKVLLDDFGGKRSHIGLCALLQLLDIYPLRVPTKGGFTWWMPNEVFITTNILPKDWYPYGGRIEQYWALARRIHRVRLHYVPLSGTDCCTADIDSEAFFKENAPEETVYLPTTE